MQKKSIIVLALLILGIGALIVFTNKSQAPAPEATTSSDDKIAAPDFELKDLQGKTWKLSDLKGKVVFLNFWATWCSSCREENPSIQRFLESQKNNDKMVFLAILSSDTRENGIAYMKQNKFTYTVLYDDKNIASAYRVRGFPETFIVDKKGMLKGVIIGPAEWDSPEGKKLLAELINE